eukprot:jgi/Botrbrau1/3947/Bobra.0365s0022.1
MYGSYHMQSHMQEATVNNIQKSCQAYRIQKPCQAPEQVFKQLQIAVTQR